MTDIELVNRGALDAANAVAWPGDDDARVSIDDEDDLKRVLDAAAPHIVHTTLRHLEAVLMLNSPEQAVGKCRAMITEALGARS